MPSETFKKLIEDFAWNVARCGPGGGVVSAKDLFAAIDALEARAEKAEAELKELKTQQANGVAGPTVTLMNERRTP